MRGSVYIIIILETNHILVVAEPDKFIPEVHSLKRERVRIIKGLELETARDNGLQRWQAYPPYSFRPLSCHLKK